VRPGSLPLLQRPDPSPADTETVSCRTTRGPIEVSNVTKRDLCRLLIVLAALCISTAATAGRGGGWYHGGGGYGGGYGGGNGGGYGGVNHGSSWSGGGSWSSGSNWSGGYHGGHYGGSWYHGGYYHGGYYGCCGSVTVGFYFGPGFIYGYPFYPYYYPPYYTSVYYPYVSGDLPQPTQYIEQEQAQAGGADIYDQGGGASQLAVWYYCDKPEGYYPYVRTCPSGWQQVPAQPPDN
jgi:hypothetical protein